MELIAFSVFCSVTVSVLLKLTPRINWDIRQVIGGGYLVAATLCLALLRPSPAVLFHTTSPTAWGLLIALGVLLPGLFLVLAESVNHVGIVLTDAAQRLSLLLPLIAAFAFFGEVLTWQKGIGVTLGLIAMVCIVSKRESTPKERQKSGGWYWPMIVFAGSGLIDILFKKMAQSVQVPFVDILFATFVMAFMLSFFYVLYLYGRKKAHWAWRHAVGAVMLGVFNFGNIVFYIKAHRRLAQDPALVFSAMNIGVIVVGALVGLWVFKEKPGRFNKAGIALAIMAVGILAYAA